MSFFTRIIATLIIFFLMFFVGACQEPDSAINNINIINSERKMKTIKIAVGEWKPFISKNQEGYGITSEIVTAILEDMGYKPEYNFMAWGEAEKIVRQNQNNEGIRITFPYPVSEDRKKNFIISGCDDSNDQLPKSDCYDNPPLEPILETKIGLFYNAQKIGDISHISSNSELEKVKELIKQRKLTLGYVGKKYGYQYTPEIQNLIKNVKSKKNATNDYHNFYNLVNNNKDRVDIIVDYIMAGKQVLYDYFPEKQDNIKLVEIEDAGQYAKLHLMGSRKNPHNSEFINKFNQTHHKLIKNKTIERIKNRAKLRPSYKEPAVVLDRCESSSKILGSDDDGNLYQIPRGTKGLLKKWKSDKSRQHENIEAKARILLLTYPYRGKQLTIDGKCLTLDSNAI